MDSQQKILDGTFGLGLQVVAIIVIFSRTIDGLISCESQDDCWFFVVGSTYCLDQISQDVGEVSQDVGPLREDLVAVGYCGPFGPLRQGLDALSQDVGALSQDLVAVGDCGDGS